MAKDIFDTILDKDYYQLTSNELAEIAEFCKNEEEFLAMKQVLLHSKTIAEGPKLAPKGETKDKLDNLFDSTYNNDRKIIPFYLNPFIQIAAVVVIGFAVWMFVSKSDGIETVQMAENTRSEKTDAEKRNTPSQEEVYSIEAADSEQKDETIDVKVPKMTQEEEYSENGMTSGLTRGYKERESRKSVHPESLPIPASADYSKKRTEAKNDLNFDAEDTAMELSEEKTNKTFSKVSAPATSVRDISVEASKSPYKNQTVVSMNVSEQKNVMNYLVARY